VTGSFTRIKQLGKPQLVGYVHFNGFFSPVDNPPVLNTVKAGASVPVKFSLNGNRAWTSFASGSPTVGARFNVIKLRQTSTVE
jgi:hypothetical protein